MRAMILAAGLGTRLKPWTQHHPKALVSVQGVPMLERVIVNLRRQGFNRIVVNVHHFADQVVSFLESRNFGVDVCISDETGRLLDTGGALLHAVNLLHIDDGPVLVHNVDILSNADLGCLVRHHEVSGADSTMLVSKRDSSRRLVFDESMRLCGWHNVTDGIFRPSGFVAAPTHNEFAFSGIHVVGKKVLTEMARIEEDEKFSIIDFLLSPQHRCDVRGFEQEGLQLIDIGKPSTLLQAENLVGM